MNARVPPFKSNFALLDVETGRKALDRYISKGNKVRIVAEIEIDHVWGNCDGISQEFGCTVKSVRVKK